MLDGDYSWQAGFRDDRIFRRSLCFPTALTQIAPHPSATFAKAYFPVSARASAGERPVNHHSVEHFWLCRECSEEYTLEYRDNHSILIPLLPVAALPNAQPVPAVGERTKLPRRSSAKRRPRSPSRAVEIERRQTARDPGDFSQRQRTFIDGEALVRHVVPIDHAALHYEFHALEFGDVR